MVTKHADRIREYAFENFIEPARRQGRDRATIKAGDVAKALNLKDKIAAVCTALGSNTFEEKYGIKRIDRLGPGTSTTTQFTFLVAESPETQPFQTSGGSETTIRLHIERLPEGGYLATSPDVPGLVAEGRSVMEAVEIAQGLTRKIIESCLEHGDPLPESLAEFVDGPLNLIVPVGIR